MIPLDVPQVFAPAANAMHFLGRVHHLEIGGETADDLQCHVRFEVFYEGREFFALELIIFAPADGPQPGVLDEFEQVIAALFAYQVTDKRAQHADIVAQ